MATTSAYLDAVSRDLWGREVFSFIPDRVLPPPEGAAERGAGPRVMFTGLPSDFSLAFLLALLATDVELVGIITSPGAHEAILGDNALSQIADHLSIPLLRLWRINDEHSLLDIARLAPEGVIMASFNQIVRSRVLAAARHGWLNVHPSLLPAYRGPEPVYWAIADGASTSGITLHRAVPKVDGGPVLAQAAVPVRPDDTSGSLTRRLTETGVRLLPGAVTALLADTPGDQPDLDNGSYRTSIGHRPLHRASSVEEAERMVRAGFPNMVAWAEVDGKPVYVLGAEVGRCEAGQGLHYPDGQLRLVETSVTCACHHDELECAHLER
ncbi:MAG: methionyl-tRNA formyltransferase [Candidatus Dormibacteria bacterium]